MSVPSFRLVLGLSEVTMTAVVPFPVRPLERGVKGLEGLIIVVIRLSALDNAVRLISRGNAVAHIKHDFYINLLPDKGTEISVLLPLSVVVDFHNRKGLAVLLVPASEILCRAKRASVLARSEIRLGIRPIDVLVGIIVPESVKHLVGLLPILADGYLLVDFALSATPSRKEFVGRPYINSLVFHN